MRFVIACLSLTLLAACGMSSHEQSQVAIMGGKPAVGHPEGALIWMSEKFTAEGKTMRCSGALIAPRIVLTAAHCIGGFHKHEVIIPSVSASRIKATRTLMYDWPDQVSPQVVWTAHDVGILILEEAVDLSSYPRLSKAALRDGTPAYSMGRVQNAVVSNEQLYQGPAYPIYDGKAKGVGHYYLSQEVFEAGDSGGAVFARDVQGEVLIGVNSGAVNGTEVIGRVDQVYTWIQNFMR